MIVVDANLLLYAHDSLSPHHDAARGWLEATFGGQEQVGLPLQSLLAFIRLATSPRVFEQPLAADDAIHLVEGWLARPGVSIPNPTEGHWQQFADVAARGQARAGRLMDAHLATLALEHGATLMTTDRGFARFPGLRFRNPIAGDSKGGADGG